MRLNADQKKIIEYEPKGHMQIKGVAGSGKTTVCVHRVPFLLTHYAHEEDDAVLLVTYNKTLLHYLEYQYHELKDSFSQQSLFEPDEKKLKISNVDKLMYQYFTQYKKRHHFQVEIAKPYETRQAMKKAIVMAQKKYPEVKIMHSRNLMFFNDEVDWIKACGIQDLESYQNIDRIGRASGVKGSPQKLLKNSKTREAIFFLMEKYDQILEKQNLIDFKTMNQWALDEAEQRPARYTHILIDECQDLTKVQLQFLKALYNDQKPYSSIMFVADNSQSIYSHSWLGKGRSFTSIGFDMKGRSRILSKNYRTTAEIAEAAFSIIENDEEIYSNIDYVKPSMIDRHGHPPIYKRFNSFEEQMFFVVKQIQALEKEYALSEMCVVARNRNALIQARDFLIKENLQAQIIDRNQFDFMSETIRLTTMHSIKGLEFKVVFLLELNEGVLPRSNLYLTEDNQVFDADEKKLFYVGMTRAREVLFMASSAKPSQYIDALDPKLLRAGLHTRLSPYYQVPIQEYRFRDQIIDLHSNEEMIRQWMLQELIEKYNYLETMMTIEYLVQSFSKTGYVDLSLHIDIKGQQTAYIFFEFKALDHPLELGLRQLKTYMEAEQTVAYGVLSNGRETIIIDRQGEKVFDIPVCEPQFLPKTQKESYYYDFQSKNEYIYRYDEINESIEVLDAQTKHALDSTDLIKIPYLGSVLSLTHLQIPKDEPIFYFADRDWIIDPSQSFFLEMLGDSMEDLGIHDGDLVLVHQQNQAEQNDLVVVKVNDEIMIKQLLFMGSDVILISQNKKYEAVNMHLDDIKVIAKVLGVLQRSKR